MENIEIKARYPDLDRGRRLAKAAGASYEGVLRQVDTYFIVANGRLKLREINGERSELIYYERAAGVGPKPSHYDICPVPDAGKLKSLLDAALGTWAVVEKKRDLYLFEEVRIHLDDVRLLGTFLEFEGVLEDESKRAGVQEKVARLISHFQIQSADLLEGSYSDLIRAG